MVDARVDGVWVFGVVERRSDDGDTTSRMKFAIVPRRTEELLVGLIMRWVEPGTQIISDKWGAYVNLNNYGFEHYDVNH